jgi:hypothetical protein
VDAPVIDFVIPQLRRPGEISALPLLPSCLYIPGEHELPPGSAQLPWEGSSKFIAGEFARWQGSRVPGRLVASAKSWLCHAGVDRSAPILPWGAPPGISKISPVDASAMLLSHIVAAWDHRFTQAPLSAQEVVLTVPASFDEAARALTIEAARRAGLAHFTLVEEPQAAFYDFTARHRSSLCQSLDQARLVLVVDVGGGTTDFSLIQIECSNGEPALKRIAVGEHLMLGGDNMDAALARQVEARLLAGGRNLSAAQWTQLVQGSRAAKESLLGGNASGRYNIAVAAEGSRLLAGTVSAEITREEAAQWILDGFFPFCPPDAMPRRTARVALQELGLPYAQDPAVTRQLTGFLKQHADAGFAALEQPPGASALPRPDAILLNGGIFNSPQIVKRFLNAISAWWPGSPPLTLLPHSSLDLAVARGAVCYGAARRGLGKRIGGGSAHAFYIGLAASASQPAAQSVCVIPRGHEEGQVVDLKGQTFNLILGRPVQFPLHSTPSDRTDRPGDIVDVDDQFLALPPIHTLFQGQSAKSSAMPVHLRGVLTELGTLELWCVSNTTDERWRLEFELRGAKQGAIAPVIESLPERFEAVKTEVEAVFGKTAKASAKETKQLYRTLEKIIGPRESWRLPLLRELWSALFACSGKRRRSSDHERLFYQLLGYGLRPGFGYPLDDWRCGETFKLFADSVQFHSEQPVWNEFWILWRRVAGGLTEAHQSALWHCLKPHLARRIHPDSNKSGPKPKGIQPEGLDQMVRTAASLEHLEPSEKIQLGNWIAARLKNPATSPGPWAWAVGRLGARVPLYGSGHKTVPVEQASEWLSLLLHPGLGAVEGGAFAIVQISRMTGDRSRDLDDRIRSSAIDALKASQAPERWLRLVAEVVPLETADEAQVLGDTLPVGLRL